MKAVVLEKKGLIKIRDIDIHEEMGKDDVKISIHTVGICGSDVHYYTHGAIGNYVVKDPMVLGHEASGTVIEIGSNVKHLRPGVRVCMEPGIPDPASRAVRLGKYNLDPAVVFWATPPVHGCLRPTVIHPAAFTYRLPDNVSYGEGALVEPLAVGMHAATKARIKPGDIAVVCGAGTIGLMTAMSAFAGGCSKVIVSDLVQPKLDLASKLVPIVPVNIVKEDLEEVIKEQTGGWGADIVFEASGNDKAVSSVFDYVCPGGRVVFIGCPPEPVLISIAAAQVKEVQIETIFRYAHMYPRALAMLESGKIDAKPLITDVYKFEDSIKAFEYTRNMKPTSIKVQIVLGV
jgi:D-xylulose reductase